MGSLTKQKQEMQGRHEGGEGCSSHLLAERAHEEGMDQPGQSLCSRPAHTRLDGCEAVGLSCSPDPHTRTIVFSERRCSSRRAVRGQSASIPKREQASLEGCFKRNSGQCSPSCSTTASAQQYGARASAQVVCRAFRSCVIWRVGFVQR